MSLSRGLARLVKRENPAWPVIYADSMGFGNTVTPVDQDFENYLNTVGTFTTVAAAVNKLVALAASVPLFQADRKTGERLDKPALVNRHGEDLLRHPNPGEGGTFFLQKSYQQLALTGNLFHAVYPSPLDAQEIWCLESKSMRPKLSSDNQYPFAGFVYQGSRKSVIVDAETVTFTRRPNPRDKIFGLSFIHECADALELLWYSRKLNIALLKRGGRTGGFLQVKGGLAKPERDRLKQEIQNRFTVDGSGRVVVISSESASFTPDTSPPRDLEHATTLTEAKLEIYNVFGFMPALFSTRDVNRSNLEDAKASAYEDVVRPFVELMLEQWNAAAWTQAKGVEVLADWGSVEALQPNKLEMAQAANILLTHQVAVPNEIAEWFGLSPKDWGEEPSRPPVSWVSGLPPLGATVDEQLDKKAELEKEKAAAAPPVGEGRGSDGTSGAAVRQVLLGALTRSPGALPAATSGNGATPAPPPREIGAPGGSGARRAALELRIGKALAELEAKGCSGCRRDLSVEVDPWNDPARAKLRRRAAERQEKLENRWTRKAGRLFADLEVEVLDAIRAAAAELPEGRAAGDDRFVPDGWAAEDWFDLTNADREWHVELIGIADDAMQSGMENAGETLAAAGLSSVEINFDTPEVREFVAETLATKVKGINRTSRDRLAALILDAAEEHVTIGELEQRIQEEFQYARRVRARYQAQTETAALFTKGGMVAMEQNGVTMHSWLSARDSRVRSAHRAIDGQVVRIGEDFTMEDPDTGRVATGAGPGMMSAAWASVNCRCTTTPEISAEG